MNDEGSYCVPDCESSSKRVHFVRPKSDLMFWIGTERREVDGVSGDEADDEEEEEENGEREVTRVQDPKAPTAEERRTHAMTHLPFRSWCRHCVRGKGKEEPCRAGGEEKKIGPDIHMDFMFMGEEAGGKTLTILIAKERETKSIMASVVPK